MATVDPSRLADLTLRLIGEPSPSGQEGGVAAVVAAEMRSLGYQVQVDRLGNVTGTLDAGPGPVLLLDSHMDTVGVTEPRDWSHDPSGERDGERLYGRGAMDMKGPLAAAIHGVALLQGRLRRGRVVVSATVAEELVEGPALAEVARGLRPDFAIICEATALRVANGQRGRAEIKVEVQGRSTHSSRPDLGVNAAELMADVIAAFRDIPSPEHPQLGRGVLVLTDIISRPYPGLSVVPDRCTASFDRRTLPGETAEAVLDPIQSALQRVVGDGRARAEVSIAEDEFLTYTGATVKAPNFAPAWYFDESTPLVAAARRGLEDAGLSTALTHYAFCTNGSATAGHMAIPTIGFGPGREELAHRVDEYIEVDELMTAAHAYAAICRQLLEGTP